MDSPSNETIKLDIPVTLSDGQIVRSSLQVSVYRPSGAGNGCAIVYYHGGGFLYGERDDLPAVYRDMITRAGYVLLCADYPLAPESTLPQIVDAAFESLRQLVSEWLPELGCTNYALFGRSAGAALALLLAKRMCREAPELPQPVAIWDFYGYYDLAAPFVHEISRHYVAMPQIGEDTVRALVSPAGTACLSGPKPTRFSLYVHGRQTGRWGELLGISPEDAGTLSLGPDDIAALPPLFITASTDDKDVPFKQSKQLSRQTPHSHMHQVYYLEHDFDRDTSNPEGAKAYREALEVLDHALDEHRSR